MLVSSSNTDMIFFQLHTYMYRFHNKNGNRSQSLLATNHAEEKDLKDVQFLGFFHTPFYFPNEVKHQKSALGLHDAFPGCYLSINSQSDVMSIS